jgi:hypothetical protein
MLLRATLPDAYIDVAGRLGSTSKEIVYALHALVVVVICVP